MLVSCRPCRFQLWVLLMELGKFLILLQKSQPRRNDDSCMHAYYKSIHCSVSIVRFTRVARPAKELKSQPPSQIPALHLQMACLQGTMRKSCWMSMTCLQRPSTIFVACISANIISV